MRKEYDFSKGVRGATVPVEDYLVLQRECDALKSLLEDRTMERDNAEVAYQNLKALVREMWKIIPDITLGSAPIPTPRPANVVPQLPRRAYHHGRGYRRGV